MIKKTTFLKTLLVAAGLCMGTSVWADEINATLVHTASSFCGNDANAYTSTVDAAKEHVNNAAFNSTWQGAAYADFSFTIPDGQTIKSAELTFYIYGESRRDRDAKVYYVNATSQLDYTELATGTAKVNLEGTEIASVTFNRNGDAVKKTQDVSDAVKAIFAAGQNNIIFKWTGNPGGGDVAGKGADASIQPTLVITTAVAGTTTSYTVKFTDGTNELKEAKVYDGVDISSEQTASAEDMAAFKVDGKKYKYVSGNTTITTVADAASNVITLVFTEAAKYAYTLKDNFGNTLVTGTDYEDEEIPMPYPRYTLQGKTFYEANATNKEYRKTITLNEDNKVETVTYAAKAGNVVFFTEAENIEGVTQTTTGNIPVRASSAVGATTDEEKTITTLSAGTYILHAGVFTSKSSVSGLTVNIGVGSETFNAECTAVNLTEVASSEYTLTENTDIKFLGITGDAQFDYIWIEKTTIPVDIKTTGTTFASASAIDCANLPAGVTAYKVTEMTASQVTAEEVTEAVKAETGLILVATAAGNYNIPVAASGSDISATNLLKAAVTEKTVAANEAYGLSEGKFYLLEAGTIPAGKAYLLADDIATAPELSIVFGGEATGIDTVKGEGFTVNGYYNLNGQRVAQPTKGLYIVNGHKVVIK